MLVVGLDLVFVRLGLDVGCLILVGLGLFL